MVRSTLHIPIVAAKSREPASFAGWRRRVVVVVLAFAAFAAYASPAIAARSDWVEGPHARARLVALGEGHVAAIEFELDAGWKTYWRTPGLAGFGVELDWTGSSNPTSAEVLWPLPERHRLFGIETLGYEGSFLLPLNAVRGRSDQASELRARALYLVCENVCVPHTAVLALTLPAEPLPAETATGETLAGEEAEDRARIAAALASVPVRGDHSLRVVEARLVPPDAPAPDAEVDPLTGAPAAVLEASLALPAGFEALVPELIVEDLGERAVFGTPSFLRAEGADGILNARLPVLLAPGVHLAALAEQPLVFTFADRAPEASPRARRGWELEASLSAPADASFPALPLAVLLFAFLGGLVLNVMPCVLPVLSLKLLSLLPNPSGGSLPSHGAGTPKRAARAALVASSLGIFASFFALALGVVVLRALGLSFGWGIQFQSPLFLTLAVVALTFFAAWLFEWWRPNLPLPAVLDAKSDRFGAHFFSGVLATLLATPCSAPFLGVAVGFALVAPAPATFAVFAALALGFAFPWLALAAFPRLLRFLPKPGAWMQRLERIFGLGLLGFVVWLLFVLAASAGGLTAAVVAALLVLLLAFQASPPSVVPRPARAAALVVLALAAPASALVPLAEPESRAEVQARIEPPWQAFSETRARTLAASGRTTLVVFTADWCITCKVNEAGALSASAVVARIEDQSVAALLGDWTRADAEIAARLERHGRFGIPFTAVYGAGAPAGILLPELLTERALLEAFEAAGEQANAP